MDSTHASYANDFSIADVESCMSQLLHGVAYIHAQGITHRDIKPGNIVPQDCPDVDMKVGHVKLADFGLAARCPHGGSLGYGGTVSYMTPEQLLEFCNESCDVWACACVLLELISTERRRTDAAWENSRAALDFVGSADFAPEVERLLEEVKDCRLVNGVDLALGLLSREWSLRITARGAAEFKACRS